MGGAGIFYAIEREQLSPQEYMTALYWAVVTVNTVCGLWCWLMM
jgi:hypothetical protein